MKNFPFKFFSRGIHPYSIQWVEDNFCIDFAKLKPFWIHFSIHKLIRVYVCLCIYIRILNSLVTLAILKTWFINYILLIYDFIYDTNFH